MPSEKWERLYIVRCQQCRFARNYGTARIKAENAAYDHMDKLAHRVIVYLAEPWLTVATPQVETLFDYEGTPPF